MNDKIRITIECGVDKEKCEKHNIKTSDVVKNITITSSDTIDGYEIYPTNLGLDASRDFVLTDDPTIISKELIENKSTSNTIDVTDMLKIIENKANKNKIEEANKIKMEEAERNLLLDKIHVLQPRISKLLLVANKCISENISFPDCMTTSKFGYGNGYHSYNFIADGINHHVGFMEVNLNNSNKPIHYLGIENGGFCGVYDFYTNGQDVFSKHETTGNMHIALIKDMTHFLDEYEQFETAFYKWVNSLND